MKSLFLTFQENEGIMIALYTSILGEKLVRTAKLYKELKTTVKLHNPMEAINIKCYQSQSKLSELLYCIMNFAFIATAMVVVRPVRWLGG